MSRSKPRTGRSSRRPLLVVASIVLPPIIALATSLSHARKANADLESARLAWSATQRDLEELSLLRARQQNVMAQAEPAKDLIARVSAIIADLGAPPNSFRGQTPEADEAAPDFGPQARRQKVRLTFRGWTIRQLGDFLDRWTAQQPLWKPLRLDLIHQRDQPDRPVYDINLTIAGVHALTPRETPTPP